MSKLKLYLRVALLVIKGKSIKEIIEKYKYKTMMLEFRSNAVLFGFDINNYSDEEIIQMVNSAGKEFSKAGLTGYEAGIAFRRLQKSIS